MVRKIDDAAEYVRYAPPRRGIPIWDIKLVLLLVLVSGMLCLIGMWLIQLPPPMCGNGEILTGLFKWVDFNKDWRISAAELNFFMLHRPCGPPPFHIIAEHVVEACDTDGDGFLSVVDYGAVNGCMSIQGVEVLLCQMIRRCKY